MIFQYQIINFIKIVSASITMNAQVFRAVVNILFSLPKPYATPTVISTSIII